MINGLPSFAAASIAPLIFLLLILAFTLGWNNSGLTTGNLANLISYRLALATTISGVLIGFLLEGTKMSHSVLGNLILSPVSVSETLSGVAISLALLLMLTVVQIPVSLSNCVVGAFAGVGLAGQAEISNGQLVEIVASWVAAPFICAALALAIYEIVARSERSLPLPTVSWANRMMLLGAVFYVSYALGANNLGLIFSFLYGGGGSADNTLFGWGIVIFLAFCVGTVLLGKSIARVIGDKITGLSQMKTLAAVLGTAIVIWAFTQFSVPISLTQVVIGGMLGAGMARGPAVVNRRELSIMVTRWSLVTLLCAGLGFLFEYFFRIR